MDYSLYMFWWFLTLLGSALFSGMEMAFISADKLYYMVNKTKDKWVYRIINRAYKQPRRFLSTLSFANLAVLVLFTYLSFVIFYPIIEQQIALRPIYIIILIVVGISIVIILSGEIIPRMIMAQKPDLWVKILIMPSYIFHLLFLPIVVFLEKAAYFILSLFGLKLYHTDEEHLNRTDINNYLRKGLEDISDATEVESEVKILRNALEFSSMRVRDCMLPRADIVAISDDASKEVLKNLFIESGISRVLVYKEDIDNIIGYIHVWEMFNESDKWHESIAEIPFVPESMQATELMNELMQQHRSIAVVFDEFGGTSGVVTIEDLVEEIFGEIDDEYDYQSKFVKRYSDSEFVLSGRVEIDTLNEEFDLCIPESDHYSTVAGYILHHTQRLPKRYETIIIDKYEFRVQKVTERKIEVVKLVIHNENS